MIETHYPLNIQIRTFKNVAEYHDIADDTLHNIQDALEELIEDKFLSDGDDDDIPEVNYSNGVLTIYLPPHGTWVINKQTPNEQLWWSSPISGPRRYEYVEERGRWVYTRIIDGEGSDDFLSSEGEDDTLGRILVQEIKKLYDCDLDLAA
jgi:frataxin